MFSLSFLGCLHSKKKKQAGSLGRGRHMFLVKEKTTLVYFDCKVKTGNFFLLFLWQR